MHPFVAKKDILITIFPIVQGKVLIDGANAHLQGLCNGEVSVLPALHRDGACIWCEIAGKELDKGGFAGAGGSDDGNKLSLLHREVDAVQRVDLIFAGAVNFCQVACL